jgi:hypothetical protein
MRVEALSQRVGVETAEIILEKIFSRLQRVNAA